MNSISLCMIVKDEEAVIGRCLASVCDLVDEIIIVDTGSSDKTKEIVRKYTEKVYDFPWIDDFSAARNYSFSKATKDYIMWLDADDVLLEQDRSSFLERKKALNPSISMVMMKYHTAFDKNGVPTFSYYRERLMLRSMNFQWVGAIHEVIAQRGNVVYWDTAVTHRKLNVSDPDRNLRIFEKLLSEGKELDPRQQFYYGRELMNHHRYQEAAQILEHFLDDDEGWIENKINACQDLASCCLNLGRMEEALCALFRSFRYDKPRAEICCAVGKYFLAEKSYEIAAYWYKAALECKPDTESGGFYTLECYDFIPYIQLCVCYDRMGDMEKAYYYHKASEKCRPDDEAVLYNRKYFNEKMKDMRSAVR